MSLTATRKGNTMRKEKKAVLMNTRDQMQFDQTLAVRILGCSYEGSTRHYSFFCANPRIEEGDLVVARDKNSFHLVTVRSIVPPEAPAAVYANNWIIGSVAEMMEGLIDQIDKLRNVRDQRKELNQRFANDLNQLLARKRRHMLKELTLGSGYGMFRFPNKGIMDAMQQAGATEFLEDTVLTHVNEKGERVLGIPVNPRPGIVLDAMSFAEAEDKLAALGYLGFMGIPGIKFAQGTPGEIIVGVNLAAKTPTLHNATIMAEEEDELPGGGFIIYGE